MPRKDWLARANGLYVALICLWYGVRVLCFDQLWWMLLLNSVAVYLFVPLPLLLALAVVRRRPRLVLVLAPALIICTALFGRQFVPAGQSRS